MKLAISPSDRLLVIDDLDRAIVDLSTRINAATYELLVLIRQFDERAGWLKWGFEHCAARLSISARIDSPKVIGRARSSPRCDSWYLIGRTVSDRIAQ